VGDGPKRVKTITKNPDRFTLFREAGEAPVADSIEIDGRSCNRNPTEIDYG
jgi:hypothetical protein